MHALVAAGHAVSRGHPRPAAGSRPGRGRVRQAVRVDRDAGAGRRPVPAAALQGRRPSSSRTGACRPTGSGNWPPRPRRARADVVVVSGLNVLPYLGAVGRTGAGLVRGRRVGVAPLVDGPVSPAAATWPDLKLGLVKLLYERAYRRRCWTGCGWCPAADAKAFKWLAGIAADRHPAQRRRCRPLRPGPGGRAQEPNSCAFWGRLDFGPNVQAVEHFARRIWPAVRAAVPDAKRCACTGSSRRRRWRPWRARDGITLTADLPDIRPAVRAAQVVVLPFVSGGGIKNKLLEAAAMGLPVVATGRARHGLVGRPPLVVAESAADWVRALTALWADAGERASVGAAGRDWVVRRTTRGPPPPGRPPPGSRRTPRPGSAKGAGRERSSSCWSGMTLGGSARGGRCAGRSCRRLVYYLYAVLRPQWLWKFQLDALPRRRLVVLRRRGRDC